MQTIGIAIPVYDDYQYLGAAIDSVVGGTFRSRLVIRLGVDEVKLTDLNKSILNDVLSKYKNLDIDVVYNHKGGPCTARNDCVRSIFAARHDVDFFFFLDSDNIVGEGMFDRLVDALNAAPVDVGYTYQDIIYFEQESKVIKLDIPFDRYRLLHQFFGDTGNMVKAQVLRDGFYFDDSKWYPVSEDVEFFRRISEKYQGIYCEDSNFFYRVKNVSRNELYWSNREFFDENIRKKLSDYYEGEEISFANRSPFEAICVENFDIEKFYGNHSLYLGKTSRSIFEALAPVLWVANDESALLQIERSPLAGFVQSQLFNAFAARPQVWVIERHPAGAFSYSFERRSLNDLDPDMAMSCVFIPHLVARDRLASLGSDWARTLEVDVYKFQLPEEVEHARFNRDALTRVFASISAHEVSRILAFDQRMQSDTFAVKRAIRDYFYIDPHASWIAHAMQTHKKFFRSKVAADVDGRHRILFATSFIGVGGVSAGLVDLIQSTRERYPEAQIDVLLSHYVRSENGYPQGQNNYKLHVLFDVVDNIYTTDVVSAEYAHLFMTKLLASYDVVQVETAFPPYAVLKDLKKEPHPPKVISHLYCWDYEKGVRVGFPIFGATYSHVVDAYSCQTKIVCDYLLSREVYPSKVFHVPYVSRLKFSETELAAALVLRKERINAAPEIFWCGRWGEQKDPGLLVDIVELVMNSGIDAKFVVQVLPDFDNDKRFDNVNFERLVALSEMRNKRVQVQVIEGELKEPALRERYLSADIMLMTSRWEGIPFVVYEAIAAGSFVISPNVSGVSELLDDKVGMMVDSREPKAFVDAIQNARHRTAVTVGATVTPEATQNGFIEGQIELIDRLLNSRSTDDLAYSSSVEAASRRAIKRELLELEAELAKIGITKHQVMHDRYGPAWQGTAEITSLVVVNCIKTFLEKLNATPAGIRNFCISQWTGSEIPDDLPRVSGWIEDINRSRQGQGVIVRGWAFDFARSEAPVALYCISGIHVEGPFRTEHVRLDITNSMPTGFHFDVSGNSDERWVLLAEMADGRFGIVPRFVDVTPAAVSIHAQEVKLIEGTAGAVDDVTLYDLSRKPGGLLEIVLGGWAFDAPTNKVAESVVVSDGISATHVNPHYERADLVSHFGEAARQSGFSVRAYVANIDKIRVFAVFDEFSKEITLEKEKIEKLLMKSGA